MNEMWTLEHCNEVFERYYSENCLIKNSNYMYIDKKTDLEWVIFFVNFGIPMGCGSYIGAVDIFKRYQRNVLREIE